MPRLWLGIIKRVVNNGVIVKDQDSLTEVLVPWAIDFLYQVDRREGLVQSWDGPWVEKQEVEEGQYVALLAETESFPNNRNDIVAINLSARITLVGFESGGVYRPPEVIVIHHDFADEVSKGNSGNALARALQFRYEGHFQMPVNLVHAAVSYQDTLDKLAALRGHPVDRIIICTHGNQGQLWLGNPQRIQYDDVVAFPQTGKPFRAPGDFGAALQELFGPGLSISICSCYLAHGDEGVTMLQTLCDAAGANFLYAAEGQVFFHANPVGKSTAISEHGSVVCFRPEQRPVPLQGRDRTSIPLFIF